MPYAYGMQNNRGLPPRAVQRAVGVSPDFPVVGNGLGGLPVRITSSKYMVVTTSGATVTTSGDYRIAVFNGSGSFTVSALGTDATEGSVVEYLVVAGGGGGGFGFSNEFGGGGGAGGMRNATGLTVAATGYTITVGGGGAGSTGNGTQGSSSSIGALIS